MATEFDSKARIVDLAKKFAENAIADRTDRVLYQAAKALNAGRDEALFVVASIVARRTKTSDPTNYRLAMDTIDSLFDSDACEFMNYDEFIALAVDLGRYAGTFNTANILTLFKRFERIRSIEDLKVRDDR